MTSRRILFASVLVTALAGCIFWSLVVAFFWAFRDFVLCWTPVECAGRSSIIAARTSEAVALSVLLAINIIAFAFFMINRRRPGLFSLAAIQLVDLAVALLLSVPLALAGDWGTTLQGSSGGVIAAVLLSLLYVFNRSLAATPDATPRSGQSAAPLGESMPPRPSR